MIDLLSLAQAAPHPMVDKLQYLVPEIILFAATVAVMLMGLSPRSGLRSLVGFISIGALIAAFFAALFTPIADSSPLPHLMPYAKALIAAVGVLLMLLLAGTVDREYEADVSRKGVFDAIKSTRGEFAAFCLFSLTGLMLTTSADDLIWLFLALELTSLPTYVMVSMSTSRARSQEAGVKYFFLGALGAATFLYGFAMIYGATGTTSLFGTADADGIMQIFARDGINAIGMLGIVLAVVGVSFKIAAVPMHFYAADVYEGAATSVSAFLAFVPKMAGFVALIILLTAVGWYHGPDGDALPDAVRIILVIMAVLTMTIGNVLAILQNSVKRLLAYSSVAHSGYMLVGLIAGPGDGTLASNGLAAVLFYMLCYGFMNLGAFAVIACLERPGPDGTANEIETVDDLKGLWATHRTLAVVMVVCAFSMLGLPPLIGFFGKAYLFVAAWSAGEVLLVLFLAINSAIAAYYYLRLVYAPLIQDPTPQTNSLRVTPMPSRLIAAVGSAIAVVALLLPINALVEGADSATSHDASLSAETQHDEPELMTEAR
ncbi:MAG: NADH-quinone oxidoreductase subunit N [Phycisphaerales bacterium]